MKEIPIRALEQGSDFGSVWVINSTHGEGRGDLVLSVARLQGLGIDNLVIPASRSPVDLTSVISRKQLLADNQFRRSVNNKLLKLVDEEDALAYVQNKANVEEWKRVTDILVSGGDSRVRKQLSISDNEIETFSDDKEEDVMPPPLKNILDLAKNLHSTGRLTEEEEDALTEKLLNLGGLSVEALEAFHSALKGVSRKLRASAKQLAGRK